MGSGKDSEWAAQYILDPLTAPEPHQDTGLSSAATAVHNRTLSNDRSKLPTPPNSASPSRASFHPSNPYADMGAYRREVFAAFDDGRPGSRGSAGNGSPTHRRSSSSSSSLRERFPGDNSHRPLEILRRESKRAHRGPHLRKNTLPRADIIDQLDFSTGNMHYHHEGPYDAVLASRNQDTKNSPIAALSYSNEEAIKATPRENIMDSLNKQYPLQGTAFVPPGMTDFAGREMRYEEGADLMRDEDAGGGAYKRWPGVTYQAGDLKGKGEPYYTIDKALKDHEKQRPTNAADDGFEMQPGRQRSVSQTDKKGAYVLASGPDSSAWRSNSMGRSVSEGLKRRLGSLRRKVAA